MDEGFSMKTPYLPVLFLSGASLHVPSIFVVRPRLSFASFARAWSPNSRYCAPADESPQYHFILF